MLPCAPLKAPPSGQVDYWDVTTRAFGVRVSQAGSKTFVAKVRNRRVTIGRYPDCSLAEARKKANGERSSASSSLLPPMHMLLVQLVPFEAFDQPPGFGGREGLVE